MRLYSSLLLVFLFATVALGESDGVTVVGVGEVKAKPTRLEIEVRNVGVGELAGDATIKLRDSVRRTQSAYEKLKTPNLSVEPLGVQVALEQAMGQEQMMFAGRAPQAAAPKIEMTRPTRIMVSGVDKLSDDDTLLLAAKLLDTAKDSGARVGPPTNTSPQGYYFRMMFGGGADAAANTNLILFTLDDASAAREQAVEKAFAEARSRAEQLAKLAGAELGAVLSVTETITEQLESDGGSVKVQANASHNDAKKGRRLVANQLMEIPVRVSLQVRYALRYRAGRAEARN